MKQFIELAKSLKCEYAENESMAIHTTMKVGGAAKLIVYPKSKEDISAFTQLAKAESIRLIAIGNGSNLIVSDSGIDAVIMIIGKAMSEVSLVDDTTIYAEAGASLMKVCRFALENELSGIEFAYGIPGSIGGAVFMNAGAYGGEMKDIIVKSDYISQDGEEGSLSAADMDLSYRHSAYYDNGFVVTGVCLKLEKGNKAEIKEKMEDLLSRRKSKQPLEYPSAGSTFKRPEGYFAGALIEECGLKGKSFGGAQVSEKHAGFVINKGGATCKDILQLCNYCSKTVFEQKGVKLEMEIRVTE